MRAEQGPARPKTRHKRDEAEYGASGVAVFDPDLKLTSCDERFLSLFKLDRRRARRGTTIGALLRQICGPIWSHDFTEAAQAGHMLTRSMSSPEYGDLSIRHHINSLQKII